MDDTMHSSNNPPRKRTMTPETLEKLKLAREKALEKKKQMKELTMKEKELKQKEFEKRIENVKQKEERLNAGSHPHTMPKEEKVESNGEDSDTEVEEIIEVKKKPSKKKKVVKKVIEVSSSSSSESEEDYRTSVKNKYKQKYKAKYGVSKDRQSNPIKETARDTIIQKANDELRRLAYSSVFPDY